VSDVNCKQQSVQTQCNSTCHTHLTAARHHSATQACRFHLCCRRGSCWGPLEQTLCAQCLWCSCMDSGGGGGVNIVEGCRGKHVGMRWRGIINIPGVGLYMLKSSW
jgi:hypothetical protein